MIDLDANATTALYPEVLAAMMPWLQHHHSNPSGNYYHAKLARKAIEHARQQVADALQVDADEIFFTSGGTESINTAIHSLHKLTTGNHAAISSIEHSAVFRSVQATDRNILYLPVNSLGRVDLEQSSLLLKQHQPAFLSVMLANNETGVIQPIQELASITKKIGIPFHCDAVQAFGKIPVHPRELGVDFLSISAHKFHGPKGIGALYIRRGIDFKPLIYGGNQENTRRSGTENTPAIIGMGLAAELATQQLDHHTRYLSDLRDHFEQALQQACPDAIINGDLTHRLPNTSHISFPGCPAEGMLILLDQANIQCSAASACMSGKNQPSHVQLAMGIAPERARTSLRFSLTALNSNYNMDHIVSVIQSIKQKIASIQTTEVSHVVTYL